MAFLVVVPGTRPKLTWNVLKLYTPLVPCFGKSAYHVPRPRSSTRSTRERGDLGHNYTMVGPTYKFDGFGYAFPRGSPLAPEISRGILELASNGTMAELEKELYYDTMCPDKVDSQTSSSLTLHSFLGLFMITGASSLLALVLHVGITCYNNWSHLISASSQDSWRALLAILSKIFHEHDNISNTPDKDETRIANIDPTVESPWSMSNHIIENFDSDIDTGSPAEGEGTPGREVSNQDPGPPSFAYMHSEGVME